MVSPPRDFGSGRLAIVRLNLPGKLAFTATSWLRARVVVPAGFAIAHLNLPLGKLASAEIPKLSCETL